MTLGDAGRRLIQEFEGYSETAYTDQRGVLTIGWGHTGEDVQPGMSCTRDEAEQWFTDDTQTAVDAVNRLIAIPLRQNEFDALVSFTFNLGEGSLAGSTLRANLNAGDRNAAAQQFLVWDHVNGVENAGLARRRAAEQALFLDEGAI